MKRMWISGIAVLSLLAGSSVQVARAQFAVIDPANLVQTTVTALRSLQQIENQVQQLTNEALMLENEAKNLKSLNFNSLSQLQATLATTNQLIAQAQGIGFTLSRAQQLFSQFYPASYGITTSQSSNDRQALL